MAQPQRPPSGLSDRFVGWLSLVLLGFGGTGAVWGGVETWRLSRLSRAGTLPPGLAASLLVLFGGLLCVGLCVGLALLLDIRAHLARQTTE